MSEKHRRAKRLMAKLTATPRILFLISSWLPIYLPLRGPMASLCLIGLRCSSKSYTRGTPVGMFNSVMTLSEILSKYFTNARSELPCAAMMTRLPCLISGAISLFQKGTTRSRVVYEITKKHQISDFHRVKTKLYDIQQVIQS